MRYNLLPMIVAWAVVWTVASLASAGDACCAHCGCAAPCEKICRLVCEEKKVEVICWGCKCEDFCIPGPSKPCCWQHKTVCEFCEEPVDCKSPCALPKSFVWREWIPGCAHIHSRKKLMRRTTSEKVPSFKWVVEEVCCQCEAQCQGAAVPPGAEVPPPPLADAKLKYVPVAP